jgi:PhzF family phenazine biosynthesis protein
VDAAGGRGDASPGHGVRPSAERRWRGRLGAALVHAWGRDEPLRPRDARDRPRDVPRPRRGGHSPLCRSGVLVAHTADNGTITLDFPTAPATEVAAPDGLAEALGVPPRATFSTGALGDLIALLDDEAAVRSVTPDLGAIARIARRDGIRGTIVTAAAADPGGGYDFVSRFFAPADGIPEDPVTGSAHTALAPFWSERLGRDDLTGLQASARGGLVRTSIHGDRVHLTGHAVVVLDGTLTASR